MDYCSTEWALHVVKCYPKEVAFVLGSVAIQSGGLIGSYKLKEPTRKI